MVFNQNIKDNLTLMGNKNTPRYLMPLLVLLVGAIIAVVIFYTLSPHKIRQTTKDAEIRKKTAVTDKMEQLRLGVIQSLIASNKIIIARQQC